jgi:hypothetical protein
MAADNRPSGRRGSTLLVPCAETYSEKHSSQEWRPLASSITRVYYDRRSKGFTLTSRESARKACIHRLF